MSDRAMHRQWVTSLRGMGGPAPGAAGMRALVALAAIMAALAVGCGGVDPVLEARIDQPDRAATGEGGPATTSPSDPVLRVAIAAVVSPQETARTYDDLVDYLEQRLDRRVEVIQKRTYSEINRLLEDGGAQVGLVCSLAYVLGHDRFGLELLAAPETEQGTLYFSYLVVPASSRAESLEDLRGTTFAFSDPLSNSGHLVPVYELSKLGEQADGFFRRTLFTYSHDHSVQSVAEGFVDGAAVDSVVYETMVRADPALRAQTRTIARWGPYGMPPLVVGPSADPALVTELRDLFLSMEDDASGAQILEDLGFQRFVAVEDDLYQSIREMWETIGGDL